MTMSEFDTFLQDKLKTRIDTIVGRLQPILQEYEELKKKEDEFLILYGKYKTVKKGKANKKSDSIKENACPNASTEILAKTKLPNGITVKKEKLSIENQNADFTMPAPKMPAPKKKRAVKKEKISVVVKEQEPNPTFSRTTRSVSSIGRTSDVIITTPEAPLIELDTSECEDRKEEAPRIRSTRTRNKKIAETSTIDTSSIRSTRTRTKKATNVEEVPAEQVPIRVTRTKTRAVPKRDRSQSETNSPNKRSRSDSGSGNKQASPSNISGRTEYEDAVSDFDAKGGNSTFVVPNAESNQEPSKSKDQKQIMNETVTIEKPNVLQPKHVDDLLTDDESVEEAVSVRPQKNKKKQKEVFSPYDKSPVKKKVEAFEKLQIKGVSPTAKANSSRILKEIEENKGNVRQIAKGFTPISTKMLAGTPSTSKIGKYVGYKTTPNSTSSTKYASPMHNISYAKVFSSVREKDVKRQEKEKEVKRQEKEKELKNEQLKIEMAEKKSKYDEKMLKIKQKKALLEKERLQALEAKREKDYRAKQLLLQKEAMQKQIREENERKRQIAKQRAEEKKKEQMKLTTINNAERENSHKADKDSRPIFMLYGAPRLPCDDCYDSDEEEHRKASKPAWATNDQLIHLQTKTGHKIKNTLFCCQNYDVDLKDIFKQLDPRKLKRTSSAIWEKPPRFTLLPTAMEDDEEYDS